MKHCHVNLILFLQNVFIYVTNVCTHELICIDQLTHNSRFLQYYKMGRSGC